MTGPAGREAERPLSVAADRLHLNVSRHPVTQRHAGSAQLADHHLIASNLLNDGRLAETHFSKPLTELRLPI